MEKAATTQAGQSPENGDPKSAQVYPLNQPEKFSPSSGVSLTKSGLRQMKIRFTQFLPTAGISPGQTIVMREDFAEQMIKQGKATKIRYI